ncbi:hypothetical protein P7C73_g3872, partial [Tremellales sp. Uapishka_1]
MMSEKHGYGRTDSASPPPPAYSHTSASNDTLTDSSHGFTLTVSSAPFRPGQTVPISLKASPSDIHSIEGDIQCVLEGMSSVQIMGKMRYQVGQIAAGGGGGGGPMMPITSREDHVFARTTAPLAFPTKDGSGGKDDGIVTAELIVPTQRTCACDGPREDGWGIMPSVPLREEIMDRSWVRWRIKVVVERKGLLKRNVKLSIDIPVLPFPHGASHQPTPITTSTPLNLTSGPNNSPPDLHTTLALSFPQPASQLAMNFTYRLATTPAPSILSADDLYPTGKLRVFFHISRRVWTQGIASSSGDSGGFNWASTRIGTIGLGLNAAGASKSGSIRLVGAGPNGLDFEGKYELSPADLQVSGCALSIKYTAHAYIEWDRIKGPLTIDVPLATCI